MLKNKLSKSLLIGAGVLVGLGAGIVGVVSAQSVMTTPNVSASVVNSASTTPPVDTPEQGDVADTLSTSKPHDHKPAGEDGVISSITGSTFVITEESNEDGSPYTVQSSGATFSINGTVGKLSDLKVGDRVFVEGTTTGTNVVATSVSLGHKSHDESGSDTDRETNDDGETGTSTNE